jgi:hypothetical protein
VDTDALGGASSSSARAAAVSFTIPQTVLVEIVGRIHVFFDSIGSLAQVSVADAKE